MEKEKIEDLIQFRRKKDVYADAFERIAFKHYGVRFASKDYDEELRLHTNSQYFDVVYRRMGRSSFPAIYSTRTGGLWVRENAYRFLAANFERITTGPLTDD